MYIYCNQEVQGDDDGMIYGAGLKEDRASMDSIFRLDEGGRAARAAFLRQMMQSFGCVHVCLWSYLPPPSNFLMALDGVYRDDHVSNQASTSYGSIARRLFDEYRESVIYVDTGRIPGLAFKNNFPYMELKLHDFPTLVSTDLQLQFYQEAGIKTIVLMGCATGEVELGISIDPHVDLEREIKTLIGMDMNYSQLHELQPHSTDPNQPPSSSSSSLRSLSVDSPELFTINPSSSPFVHDLQPPTTRDQTVLLQEALRSVPTTSRPHHHQVLSQIRNTQIPSIESEDAAMTKAILAVLTSPSTSSSSHNPTHNNPSAFRRFQGSSSSSPQACSAIPQMKQNKFKRAVLFFRSLNWRRRSQDLQAAVQGGNMRPTATQLHHMISERRRREKLNESFHILRSLLPPGSKKDKASVLGSTTEYLSSMKSQVAELSKRNQMLESQLSARKPGFSSSSNSSRPGDEERTSVEIVQVSSSTQEARFLDLRVSVGGERSLLDLVIGLLEFLKQQNKVVSLVSVESNTRMLESSLPLHVIVLRLKIEGDGFDEAGFEEGIKKVVDDMTN